MQAELRTPHLMRESCHFNRTLLVSIYLPAQKMRRGEGDLCSKARGTDNKAQLLLRKYLIVIRNPPCTALHGDCTSPGYN
jgi:hypothetical protein